MDPSTQTSQDMQNQTPSDDQPVDPAQTALSDDTTQPASSTQPQKQQQVPKHPISVGGGIEAGAAVVEDADEDDDDDEELLVSPQETKNRAVLGQNEEEDSEELTTIAAGSQMAADFQENVELRPSGAEAAVTAGPEVEKVVERVEDQERPSIPKEVQDAGVTHSGPGIIVVEQQNNFGVSQMPVSYAQAAAQYKKTKLHDSRHWFLLMMMYIWRKLQGKKGRRLGSESFNSHPANSASMSNAVKAEEAAQDNNGELSVP